MSAQLATSNFTANLALPDGVSVHVSAPTYQALGVIVAKLAANDAGKPSAAPSASPAQAAATAPAGQPATTTAASSAPAAAAPAAGDAGNGSAAPAAAAATSSGAPGASSGTPTISLDDLKAAFIAMSKLSDGRGRCERVLASVSPALPKLSAAAPEQYPALMKAIEEASK